MQTCTNCQHPIRGATFASGFEPDALFCRACHDRLPDDEAEFRRYLGDLRRAQAERPAIPDLLTRQQRLDAWIYFA